MTMGRLLYFRCSRCGQLLSFSGQSASLWIMSSSELLCRIKEMLKFWPRRYNVFRDLATLLCWQSMIHICSVLFFSRPRSECSPHYGRTFPIYLSSVILIDSLTRSPVHVLMLSIQAVRSRRAWSSSLACTWHCSLHYLFLQATPSFSHGVTIVC